jgi:hypothetical protein
VLGQHLFFAAREDLRPGLGMIESQWELEGVQGRETSRYDRSQVSFRVRSCRGAVKPSNNACIPRLASQDWNRP